MSDSNVTFESKGRKLAGTVRVPDGVGPGERRPAWIVMHGFGSNRTSSNVLEPCAMFEQLGYVTLRFDMPGCGESEGERGHLICLEQVQAASDALTSLAKHPNVEGDRIGMIGSSFGAAIAVYAIGVDKRVAVIAAEARGYEELSARGVRLSPAERRAVRRRLLVQYGWQIGYTLLWQSGRRREALAMLRRGLSYWPWELRAWKTYLYLRARCALAPAAGQAREYGRGPQERRKRSAPACRNRLARLHAVKNDEDEDRVDRRAEDEEPGRAEVLHEECGEQRPADRAE